MEFFKNFFNDDDRVCGLCALKKKSEKSSPFHLEPAKKFNAVKFLYDTNTSNNFFLL